MRVLETDRGVWGKRIPLYVMDGRDMWREDRLRPNGIATNDRIAEKQVHRIRVGRCGYFYVSRYWRCLQQLHFTD